MANVGFVDGVRRELHRLGSRKIYIFGMVLVPLVTVFFFLDLLGEGLPQRVPTAVVDMDQSAMSRSVTRSLDAIQMISIDERCESYDDALDRVRQGKIFGFFVIPENFEKNTLAGNAPTLEYYTNMTYFVPGTLAFKGFKTVAVSTSAGVVMQTLQAVGIAPDMAASLVQPVSFDINALNNPWMNYAYYLCPSFTMATLALMITLMTVLSITSEIKFGTSPQWLATARGNIWIALASKLLPQTLIFSAVAVFSLWAMFGVAHMPLNGSLWAMIAATILLVMAAQGFAVFVASIVPNPRLAFSICALFGILSFSFTGFSFPVQSMYGALAVFSYLAPIRYWFLIYINEALNGVPLYFSRLYFVALILFPFVGCILAGRLRKALLNPVYVP